MRDSKNSEFLKFSVGKIKVVGWRDQAADGRGGWMAGCTEWERRQVFGDRVR